MRTIGTFEIFEVFKIRIGIALAGKYISGEPISNEKDILEKNICISFKHNGKKHTPKITRLDGGFGRARVDTVMEENQNIALLIEIDREIEYLDKVEILSPIIGEIIEKSTYGL